jgi:hypothetical protein
MNDAVLDQFATAVSKLSNVDKKRFFHLLMSKPEYISHGIRADLAAIAKKCAKNGQPVDYTIDDAAVQEVMSYLRQHFASDIAFFISLHRVTS